MRIETSNGPVRAGYYSQVRGGTAKAKLIQESKGRGDEE